MSGTMGFPVKSELTGILVSLEVAVGDSVDRGQNVATIESMKMHLPVQASHSGTVAEIHADPGDYIEEGQDLLLLK